MGKGEGVVVEADVGYKDGQAVFSPHAANQSHVEEDAQVCRLIVHFVVGCFYVDNHANATTKKIDERIQSIGENALDGHVC